MNPQERELLSSFLQQLTQTQAGQKDSEAEALIRAAVARQPDAAYLLAQRAMALDYALQATQAQVTKLQAELDRSRPGAPGSFLGNSNSWGRAAPGGSPVAAAQAQGPAGAVAARLGNSGPGLLGTVASTAAGVVAGSFLFQGIQGLMGHHNAVNQAAPSAATPKDSRLDSDEVADATNDDSTDSASYGEDLDSGDLV